MSAQATAATLLPLSGVRYASGALAQLDSHAETTQPQDLAIVLDTHKNMGLGIRADVNIKKGMWLGTYTGEIKTDRACKDTGYVASLNWPPSGPTKSQLVVDAGAVGNVRNSHSVLSHANCVYSGLVMW
jgi:hypothetical protein